MSEMVKIASSLSTPLSSNRALAASIGKNTLFGVGSNAVQMATRLITVPIVIAHLGLDGYGIWSIIMTAAAYMRFGSVGIKSAFQKYVAEATGSGSFKNTSVLISTGSFGMLMLSMAGLIPTAIYSRTLAHAAGVPEQFLSSAAGAISVLALIMAVSNAGAAYEAIVMGGHRIDLTRKFGMLFTTLEAIGIVLLLHFGCGLFAMAAVIAASDLGYVACNYFMSRRVLPQIQIHIRHFRWGAVPELLRFAGSYQVVNILEVLYSAILPVAVLRFFGAEATGVYALASRLVSAALIAQDALLPPILSGGSMVYGAGAIEKMKLLILKSYKMTLALTLAPLAFVGTFGTLVILAWTGQSGTSFRGALILISLASLFKSLSLLELVLYRISGKALLDNIRQVLRIITLLLISAFGGDLGFYGILAGLAVAEFAGMLFMFFALQTTFQGLTAKMLVPDTLKVLAATILVMVASAAAVTVPFLPALPERSAAMIKLILACMACAVVAWPALLVTRSLSKSELETLIGSFSRKAYGNA
jgi:O-antigen/teichoic acid export membrane protein